MKSNFLQLIHQTAAEKKRLQEVRLQTGSSRPDSDQQNTIRQITIPLPIDDSEDQPDPEYQMISQSEISVHVQEVFTLDPLSPRVREDFKTLKQNDQDNKRDEILLLQNPVISKNIMDPSKKYLNDIDRKLAMFYHPLFLEITDAWIQVFLGPLSQGREIRISFIAFVEMNLRLQRSLLAKFDLSSAFVSALKDWVKEIGDCFQMKSLYFEDDKDVIAKNQINELPFTTALSEQDYQKFFDSQKTLEIYRYFSIKVSKEVIGKFLFDLCVSWCQHLDIELFAYFLLGLLLQISEGSDIRQARLIPLNNASLLPVTFLQDFEQQVQLYSRYKRKNLSYYRAWCEWNYLRMEEIGEIIIQKLLDTFAEDDRAESIVSIFSKAIDIVGQEITHQVDQIPVKVQKQLDNIDKPIMITINQSQNRELQLNQEQFLYQDYRLEKIPAQVPDQFIITYNEQEQAFILERKVKMPVLGQKLNINHFSGQQRVTLEKQHIADHKDAYVYYVSDNMTKEIHQDLINNIHKPKLLPVMNRRKPIEMVTKEPQIQVIQKKKTRPTNLNNSFSHASANIQQKDQQIPIFESDNYNFQFHDPPRFQLDRSMDQGYKPVYKTSKRINQDYSHNITVQRRDLKVDVPKTIFKSKFQVNEFQKFIARNDPSTQLGKINQHIPPAQQKGFMSQAITPLLQKISPLENDRIAEMIKITKNYDSSQFDPMDEASIPEQLLANQNLNSTHTILKQSKDYSLHNVKLTFEQLESLQQNKHLWEPVLSWEEVKLLRQDDNKFYHILQLLKLKFNQEHKSEYLKQLRLEFNYASRRDEMGGAITVADKDRFLIRIEKLIKRDKVRREKRKKRRKAKSVSMPAKAGQIFKTKVVLWDGLRRNFKNIKSRNIYKEVFVNPLKLDQ